MNVKMSVDVRGTMYFDGECTICTRMARRFEGLLARHGFRTEPMQAARAVLGLKEDEPLTEIRVLDTHGKIRGGAEAVVFLSRHIWWASPLVFLWHLPGGQRLLNSIYRWIAERRTCIGGTCAMPRPNNQRQSNRWMTVAPLLLLPVTALVFGHGLPGWAFMWAVAFAIFYGCKWLTFRLCVPMRKATTARRIAYLLAWPGMDAAAFVHKTAIKNVRPKEIIVGLAKLMFGLALFFFVPRHIAHDLAAGWVGMVGAIFVLHFGLFDLIARAWRAAGIDARPLMVAPICARSLGEFWGRCWNAAFNRLTFDHVFRPLARRIGATWATLASFAASGLIHDLVISVPARDGYGLPTAFFLLQGAGLLLEHSSAGRKLGLGRGARGWLFTMTLVAGPAFFLFHPPFVRNVFLPFMHAMGAL